MPRVGVFLKTETLTPGQNLDSNSTPLLRLLSAYLWKINQVVSDVFIFLLYNVECVCLHSLGHFSIVDKRYWCYVNVDITTVAC